MSHTQFISILSGFFLLFLVEGVIVVSSPSTVGCRLVHMLDHLLQLLGGCRVMTVLLLCSWVVYFPLEPLHFSLHIQGVTGRRGGA